MNARNFRMMLRPGMMIKRWLALLMISVVLLSLALAMGAAWVYRHYDVPGQFQGFVRYVTLQVIPHPWREIIVFVVGLFLLGFSIVRLSRSLIGPLLAGDPGGRALAEILNEHRFGPKPTEFNVVTIGGGTGLSALLRGLKRTNVSITAIVTVADDGGSTGRIRNVFNIPAPGDIRNCLVALADAESTMGQLFHYRFDKEESELAGHAFGNLFITAMTQVTGSFEEAVTESARVLAVHGRVLPSTLENVTLCADLVDGTTARGESTISHEKPAISRIFLEPQRPEGYRPALAAILNADLIILGPGSLYTSVLPNLLVDGVNEAIRWSSGTTMYVCNVATQEGETDDLDFKGHVDEIVHYLGKGELDYVLVNNNPAPDSAIRPEWNVKVIAHDGTTEQAAGAQVIARDVVSDRNPLRHDPEKLAQALLDIGRMARTPAYLNGQHVNGAGALHATTDLAEPPVTLQN
jgi:uncharacterized cofD-like protein